MKYVVIDVEATCDDRGAVPRPETEIVEVGAVMVRRETLEVVDEFQSFVRPVRHPRLTDFCTRLTSIRQEDVDAAPPFPEVFERLTAWIHGHEGPIAFCSWGDYDRSQFDQDCRFHGIRNTLPDRHVNLKRELQAQMGGGKKLGMDAALARLGLELAGTHHRGIDDARNIARILPYALGARPVPPDPAPDSTR